MCHTWQQERTELYMWYECFISIFKLAPGGGNDKLIIKVKTNISRASLAAKLKNVLEALPPYTLLTSQKLLWNSIFNVKVTDAQSA